MVLPPRLHRCPDQRANQVLSAFRLGYQASRLSGVFVGNSLQMVSLNRGRASPRGRNRGTKDFRGAEIFLTDRDRFFRREIVNFFVDISRLLSLVNSTPDLPRVVARNATPWKQCQRRRERRVCLESSTFSTIVLAAPIFMNSRDFNELPFNRFDARAQGCA